MVFSGCGHFPWVASAVDFHFAKAANKTNLLLTILIHITKLDSSKGKEYSEYYFNIFTFINFINLKHFTAIEKIKFVSCVWKNSTEV
jgi:hypothetical protein